MLTCTPDSFLNWNFTVIGAAAGPASIRFNFLSEQGIIEIGGIKYTVKNMAS